LEHLENFAYIHKNQISTNLTFSLGNLIVKKFAVLYCSFVILGTVFLALALVGGYLAAADSLSVLASFSLWYFGGFFVLGGIVMLTIGIVGIGRQYFKNRRRLFTVLAILLVPPLIFGTFIVGYAFAFISAPMFPLRSEITQVTVVDVDPLVLCLNVRAITSRDTRIESAFVLNSADARVAQVPSDGEWEAELAESGQFFTLAELPGGSEISLTLDFNTSLPSGDYLVRLTCWHSNQGSSPFTIP
jgi:hypothetical protein